MYSQAAKTCGIGMYVQGAWTCMDEARIGSMDMHRGHARGRPHSMGGGGHKLSIAKEIYKDISQPNNCWDRFFDPEVCNMITKHNILICYCFCYDLKTITATILLE
jgi:hypothetical protein